jgi:DNA-binding SARP family transcriptional activator
VADLFKAADTEPPAQASGRVDIPVTLQGIDDATFAAAQSRVGILGPVEVRATGPMDPSRVPLAQEIVTYLAAHPDGVHPGVLAAAIWPRGVTNAVSMATIDRIRDWLGDDPDGAARLRTDENGRYLLAPSVAIDWHGFCTLLLRSRSASSPHDEGELLRRALHLVRGPVLQDRPATRYTWLVRTPLERTIEAVVVDAAHRLAEISSDMSDPADAAAASLAGLRLAPTAQLLWRDLLGAVHKHGGGAALHAAVADMQETMDRAGLPVDAETEALIEHLRGDDTLAARPAGTATGA